MYWDPCAFKLSQKVYHKLFFSIPILFSLTPQWILWGFSVPLHFVPDFPQAEFDKLHIKTFLYFFSPPSRSFKSFYTLGSRSTASQARCYIDLFSAKSDFSCSYSLSKLLHWTTAFYPTALSPWIQLQALLNPWILVWFSISLVWFHLNTS